MYDKSNPSSLVSGLIRLSAASAPVTPTSFAGLVTWFDFTDSATVTIGASGIQTVADKSGHAPGQNATQLTAGRQPAYVGNSYVDFSPGSRFLYCDAGNFFNDNGVITVLARARFTSHADDSQVIDKWKSPYIFQMYDSADGKVRFTASTDAGSVNQATATSAALSTDTWYQLVGTYDGTNVRLYINGTLVDTVAMGTPGALYSGSDQAGLGARINPDSFMRGHVQEIAVWDQVLTAQNIADLYTSGY